MNRFCTMARRSHAHAATSTGTLAGRDGPADAGDALAKEAPVLAGITAASVVGSIALGPRAGAQVRRCGELCDPVEAPLLGRRHARLEGFDLHENVSAPASNRERLERLCRYALRPAIAHDRLQLTADGQVVLQLRRRWSDGTTHLLFDPIELLERLAALTPRCTMACSGPARVAVRASSRSRLPPGSAVQTAPALVSRLATPAKEPHGRRVWPTCKPPRNSRVRIARRERSKAAGGSGRT
jgi:hypothetical protein